MLPCQACLSICFARKYIFCLSEAPCLAPRLLFLLIRYPGIKVTSRLFWSNRWTSRRLHISSTAAMDYSHFPESIAVRAELFGRIFAKLEDLGVVHLGDQILRFLAELIDLLRLVQVLKEGFLVRVALELLNQLLDLVFAMNCQLPHCIGFARRRHPRRRWAAPEGCPLAIFTIQATQKKWTHLREMAGWWWWWCVVGREGRKSGEEGVWSINTGTILSTTLQDQGQMRIPPVVLASACSRHQTLCLHPVHFLLPRFSICFRSPSLSSRALHFV